jgi:hypothetical protein
MNHVEIKPAPTMTKAEPSNIDGMCYPTALADIPVAMTANTILSSSGMSDSPESSGDLPWMTWNQIGR